jgi:hypothetical protein
MLLFHLVIHEIQVTKPFNYIFGFCCEDVCVGTLQFGYFSFWGCHQGLGRE